MAQAEATIARNSAQRNTDWKPYFRLRLGSTYFYKKKNILLNSFHDIFIKCAFLVAIIYILIFMVLNML